MFPSPYEAKQKYPVFGHRSASKLVRWRFLHFLNHLKHSAAEFQSIQQCLAAIGHRFIGKKNKTKRVSEATRAETRNRRFCWPKKNKKSIGEQRLLPPDIDEKVTINMWDMVLVYNFSKNKDINERLSPKVKLKHLVMFTLKGGKYK